MKCPRDHQNLKLLEKNNTVGHRCHVCDGMFLNHKGALAFDQNYQSKALKKLSRSSECSNNSLTCPGCKQVMKTKVIVGIEIDHCEHCGGLWFDHWEIESLIKKTGKTNNSTQTLSWLTALFPWPGGDC